jgi:hypothetical protein
MEATQTVLKLMQEAAATHAVDLIMLPELCPFGYSEDTFAKYLPTTPEYQAMYEQIDQQLQEASKTMDCAICYVTSRNFSFGKLWPMLREAKLLRTTRFTCATMETALKRDSLLRANKLFPLLARGGSLA